MAEWVLKKKDLKNYPHFDPPISIPDAIALATTPSEVARHTFYPFMLFEKKWRRFSDKGGTRKEKIRPIRYAARRDAYIFSRYRHILSERYETKLEELGLSGSILAYRRIRDSDNKGKCNIDFALDAFERIRSLGNCSVIALDISSYFESLDHERLKQLWCDLLGVKKLPADHFKVFEAITRYAVVDKKEVYTRLGFFGEKSKTKDGKPVLGYLVHHKKIPMRLCSGHEFRQKVAGHGPEKTIIRKNKKPYGIPQGAPISDLLANLYLIEFDSLVAGWAQALGGEYYRYSDDILILVPGDDSVGSPLMQKVRDAIGNYGEKLKIKEEKSSLFVFSTSGSAQTFSKKSGSQGENGLEYLGFRFDGKLAYIRDSTLSNLYRKVTRSAHKQADTQARRYPDKSAAQIKAIFDYNGFIESFGRVEDFDEKSDDYKNWTFWTYAKRASERFGQLGAPMLRQLKRHRLIIRHKIDSSIEQAVVRRERRKAALS